MRSAKTQIGSPESAITQQPIVAMIENYRAGLLWTPAMNDPNMHTAGAGWKS